jgi:hypothetical protein
MEERAPTMQSTTVDLIVSRLKIMRTAQPTIPIVATSKRPPNANLKLGSLSSKKAPPRKIELIRKKTSETTTPTAGKRMVFMFRKIKNVIT